MSNTNMLHHHEIKFYHNETVIMKVIEQTQISPPPSSLPSPTRIPLTFFDISWFYCKPPLKRIFFYHFPHPTHHFLQTTLPILKHSLSLTLQHFFPFTSNLIIPPNSHNTPPFIRYLDEDSISFTIAESSADFNILISDSQDAQNWHPLVPNLPPPRTEQNGTCIVPLMAIQITILPNSGFSICLAFKHVVADGKSLHHFMKFWAFVSKAITNNNELSLEYSPPLDLPSHERDRVLKHPTAPKLNYFQEIQYFVLEIMKSTSLVRDAAYANKVRTSLVLSREEVQKMKGWIIDKCKDSTPHMSTFVVTCSLIWFCMVKSEQSKSDLVYFMFFADCRDRREFSLSKTYFGNCLASYTVVVNRGELVGKDGILVAANAIERKIRDFKSDALLGVETLMPDYREIIKPGNSVKMVSGSPKLDVYETDFGWGKPKKSDVVHIDSSSSISLSDCRDGRGGIEVGLALERSQMTNFISIYNEQLGDICSM
ncbi:putative transferase [Medicago truncatula]|uniref:Anthocyanin 5-aromatic acyltransferase n=2 Tax=Medicago truncatula TaxID=3880 RepID=G7IRP3_MEDTR|nr:anthocyanin 5-aromatic acyltransferase [Medicago truncatula]RHN75642.1 putative transferase [Medicago truncatula]